MRSEQVGLTALGALQNTRHDLQHVEGLLTCGAARSARLDRLCHIIHAQTAGIDGIIKAIGLPADKVCTYCWTGEE